MEIERKKRELDDCLHAYYMRQSNSETLYKRIMARASKPPGGAGQAGKTTGRRQSQHGQGATGQVLRAEGGPQTAGEQDFFHTDGDGGGGSLWGRLLSVLAACSMFLGYQNA